VGCSSCKQDIIRNCCGCGCSTCKPFEVPTRCRHCPPAPAIEPCGYRVLDDGTQVPVWNPSHPLIPRFREMYMTNTPESSCNNLTDGMIANYLRMTEPYFNTCRFAGDLYYQAIMLRTASLIEYDELIGLYRASLAASIATGSKSNMKFPKREETFYGQLLADLERQNPANLGGIFI
jgi:hypothetical protein